MFAIYARFHAADNSTVTGVVNVNGWSNWFDVTVTPSGGEAVEVQLLRSISCTGAGAICSTTGKTLSKEIAVTIALGVAAPPPPPPPLRAKFLDRHYFHYGASRPFVAHLQFSEKPADLHPSTVKNLFTVTGGVIQSVTRSPSKNAFNIKVQTSSYDNVTLELATPLPECGESGSVCTEDGRALSGRLKRTWKVKKPWVSVQGTSVSEGPNAALEFPVSLSFGVSHPVTVDYATSDGTAVAGEDYTATSGTLTFAARESRQTISVPVLDDAHDEGIETLTLTITSPGGARLGDDSATGTIRNADPVPQAWLARFGRSVAGQVLGAVESRMRASRSAGVEVRIAGQRIGGGAPDEAAIAEAETQARLAAFADWLHGGECDGARGASGAGDGCRPDASRAVSERDLFTGSAFTWTLGSEESGAAALWGEGAITRFDGREDELTLDGEVASAMLGADWAGERTTAGVVVSVSRGEGEYRGADSGGEVESTLAGVYPWGRHALTERVEVWGVAGYGEGELVLTPEGGRALAADMDLAMAAAGARGTVRDGGAGGLTLAVTGDALGVRTTSEAVSGGAGGNLAPAEATVTRLRLGLEGVHPVPLAGGAVLTPSFEIGVRHDGGDAETGFGADIGAGVVWSDRARGIEAELRGRGLVTHEESGFGERGVAGRVAWDPHPDSPLGLSLSVSQTVGTSASGGMEALLGPDTARTAREAAGVGDALARRLEAKLGYGLPVLGGRFVGTPEFGVGLSESGRDYRVGWRLGLARQVGHVSVDLEAEATRREAANDDRAPEHGVGLRLSVRW